jgi:fructose-1-phosphate kinase PfkB-like protein
LQERDIALVAATQGAEGAILAANGKIWEAVPPEIEFASAVASGDSFVAAFLRAWKHGEKPGDAAYALRLATGAGAANAAVIGAGFCTRDSIFSLAERAQVQIIE